MGIDPITLSIGGMIASSLFSSFSGKEEKSAPAQIVAPKEETGKTAEQITQEKQRKLVAANAGTQTAFSPLSNEEQSVTSKTLLGL